LQVGNDVKFPCGGRLRNSRVKVVAFLKIHVNDVVAADNAVQRHRVSVHIDAVERRDFSRQRQDVAHDILEIPELPRQLC
jgi:hypothetical protein